MKQEGDALVDLYQLQLFLSVVETGSVTKAAAANGLTAGAVSQQLAKLSQTLRTELFVKAGRGLRLSPSGQHLASHAGHILGQIRSLSEDFAGDPATDRRELRLATGAATLMHRLREPLRQLRAQYPIANIRITAAPTEEMVDGLLEAKLDLAIISLPIDEAKLAGRLIITPLYEEELVLIQPAGKELRRWELETRPGESGPSLFGDLPWLLYPMQSNMRGLINNYFQQIGFQPEVVVEASETELLLRLVENGFGQSILPLFAVQRQVRNFRAFTLPEQPLVRRQALATTRAALSRPLVRAVVEMLNLQLGGDWTSAPSVRKAKS